MVYYLRHNAVGGGDNEPVCDQRSPAEEHAVNGYGHMPSMLPDSRVGAADNPPVVSFIVQELLGRMRLFPVGRLAAAAAAVAATASGHHDRRLRHVPRRMRVVRGNGPLPEQSLIQFTSVAIVATTGTRRRRQVGRRLVTVVVVVQKRSDGRNAAVWGF